jgi:hypothetical protein
MDNVILHLSDWNSQDKYYELSLALLKEFYKLLRQHGLDGTKPLAQDHAWKWFHEQVDYEGNLQGLRGLTPDEKPDKPIKFGLVDMRMDTFFLDWNNYEEGLDEWQEEWDRG